MIKLASRYLKHYIGYIVTAIILVAIQTYVQMVLLMGEMKKILDQGVAVKDMDFIYSTGVKMVLYTILIGALTIVISYLTAKVSGIFMSRMRKDCYIKVLRMTPEAFNYFGGSTLTTRTIDDPKAVVSLYQFLISRVIMIPMVVICILGLIYTKSQAIFWILLCAVVCAMTLLALLEIYAKKYNSIFQQKIDKLNQLVREKITGVRSIRAFGNEEKEEQRGINHDEDLYKSALKANQPTKLMNPLTMIIFNWVMVIIYYVGSIEIKNAMCSISDLILIFQYLSYFTMALSLIPTLVNMMPKAQVSADRLIELLDYDCTSEDLSKESNWDVKGTIECKNVTFGYDKNRPVLKNISFKVNAGETLGIIGTTGSGKSSLLQVIMGFYRIDKGDILIDNHSIRDINNQTLLSLFSYSPQISYVFQDSAKNNIVSFDEHISEDRIQEACYISKFDEVVPKLAEGLATEMSQGGMNLSGGQRKRLSLARAIAKDAPIYLLDEPYAALDAITEKKVATSIKDAKGNRTKIIVSAKINSIKDANNILVLEQGEVVGFGTHEELLKTCKEYKEIYDTQCYLDREE